MILTQPTKFWATKFIILDGSYMRLFNEALKNLELNQIEDKNKAAFFSYPPLKTEKAD